MKTLVTLPEDLVAQIDAVCGARGRSAEIEKRLRASFDGVALVSVAHPSTGREARYQDIRPLALTTMAAPKGPKVMKAPSLTPPSMPYGSRLKKK